MSKSDSLRVADYLAHIVEAIDRIHRYVEDMAEIAFLEDEKTQDAVIRNFEISPRICPSAFRCALGADVHHAQPRCSWLLQSGL